MSNESDRKREPLAVVVNLCEPDEQEDCSAVASVELEAADPDNRQLHLTPVGDPDRVTTVTFSEAAAREIFSQLLAGSGA